jgi:hypothetical protein
VTFSIIRLRVQPTATQQRSAADHQGYTVIQNDSKHRPPSPRIP